MLVCCIHGAPCARGRAEERDSRLRRRRLARDERRSSSSRRSFSNSAATVVSNSSSNSGGSIVATAVEGSDRERETHRAASVAATVNAAAAANINISNLYLGACSKNVARRQCREPTSFRLYHHLDDNNQLDSLAPELSLYIVYRASSGHYV